MIHQSFPKPNVRITVRIAYIAICYYTRLSVIIKDISYEFRWLSSIPQNNCPFDVTVVMGLAGMKVLILVHYPCLDVYISS